MGTRSIRWIKPSDHLNPTLAVSSTLYVTHLSLHNFRSYADIDVVLQKGPTAFIGRNGQGKTNLVEAIDYLSRLSSHRVATDAPLIRAGAEQAVVRAAVVRDGRTAILEVELNPGRANRARINKSPLPRPREIIGLVRTVVFAPDDLTLVKGDPSERRRFLDELAVLRLPRLAAVRADYDRILRQRNSLLKSAGLARGTARDSALATLQGACECEAVARGASREDADIEYKSGTELSVTPWQESDLAVALANAITERRNEELARGISLVGPHRDDLLLTLGNTELRLPVKGYASHGESWSFALALRLASYDLLRAEGDDPILILDDVFAELDSERRLQLADLVGDAEQVLVTAAVAADVPESLQASRFLVAEGEVTRDE